ncbi:unnamed protein product [Allacma fusca]|uniref:Uncharacterized protein n=1 Tax=Allacma fusca TaxID=39272 RepID=A0A8J2L0Y9_9HEXA|nr:unnamed protein product [Allacma fusca]
MYDLVVPGAVLTFFLGSKAQYSLRNFFLKSLGDDVIDHLNKGSPSQKVFATNVDENHNPNQVPVAEARVDRSSKVTGISSNGINK